MFHSQGVSIFSARWDCKAYYSSYQDPLNDMLPAVLSWNDGVYMERNTENGTQGVVLVSTDVNSTAGEVLAIYKQWGGSTMIERIAVGARSIRSYGITTLGEVRLIEFFH